MYACIYIYIYIHIYLYNYIYLYVYALWSFALTRVALIPPAVHCCEPAASPLMIARSESPASEGSLQA